MTVVRALPVVCWSGYRLSPNAPFHTKVLFPCLDYTSQAFIVGSMPSDFSHAQLRSYIPLAWRLLIKPTCLLICWNKNDNVRRTRDHRAGAIEPTFLYCVCITIGYQDQHNIDAGLAWRVLTKISQRGYKRWNPKWDEVNMMRGPRQTEDWKPSQDKADD